MVTAVTSMGRSGLYDWLMQRVTAVILLAYFPYVGCVLLGGVDYASWKELYSQTWMRVFSLLALLSLGIHAWVGLWAVFTDYLTERLMGTTGNVLRFRAQVVCAIIMFTYVVWGIQILWGFKIWRLFVLFHLTVSSSVAAAQVCAPPCNWPSRATRRR